MLICIYGFVVCSPKPHTWTQQSGSCGSLQGNAPQYLNLDILQHTAPARFSSARLLASTAYGPPNWGADPSQAVSPHFPVLSNGSWGSSLGSITKPPKRYHSNTQHAQRVSAAISCPPLRKAMSWCSRAGSRVLLRFFLMANGHGYGISLAEAAGGRACNLQYVRLHTRCGEGRMEEVVSCGARFLCCV